MSSSSLAATTLVASSSSGSNSTGHTSPSVSSMEEDPNLSASEASFDPNNQQPQQPQQPQQQLKPQPSPSRTPGKHADVELDAANMLSSLKHFMPAPPRKGSFAPAAPTGAGGITRGSSIGSSSSAGPAPLARDASSSFSSSLSALSSAASTTTPSQAPQPKSTKLPRRPPTKAVATLFPTLSPAAYTYTTDAASPAPAKRDQQAQPAAAAAAEEESLIIEDDDDDEEEEEMMDDAQSSAFSFAAPAAAPTSAASSSALCRKAGCKWTAREDARLRAGVAAVGECGWETISVQYLRGQRSAIQCSHRWQKVLRPGLVKGPWRKAEDEIIISCRAHGILEWKEIALRLPGRLGKQCRDRWLNHLDPSINKGEWSPEEDERLAQAREKYGNAWAYIAKLLPGRPENAIKNRWYSARRAQERSVVAAPSGWDLRAEKKAIADFAYDFAALASGLHRHTAAPAAPPTTNGSDIGAATTGVTSGAGGGNGGNGKGRPSLMDSFLPQVTARLRLVDPAAYDPARLPEVNRQKLQRRLWAGLKREAAKYPEGSPLRQAMLREKGTNLRYNPTTSTSTQLPPQPPQQPAPPAPQPLIPHHHAHPSNLSSSYPMPPPAPLTTTAADAPPSPHVMAVIELLLAAVDAERNPATRALYLQALEATTKASRTAICFIEGVMGGGYAGLDLHKPADREYLLGTLASAVARGLFV